MAGTAELSVLIKARDEASKVLGTVQKSVGGVKSGLAGLQQAAGSLIPMLAGAVGAIAGLATIKSSITTTQELGAEIGQLRRVLGITPEEASKLDFALKHLGMTAEDVLPAFGIFQKNLVHAKDALEADEDVAKTFGRALDKLGLSELKTTGATVKMTVVLAKVADRFKAMENGAEKNAIAMDLFGRSGRDLIPLLNLGSDGLEEMAKQAEKFGLVLSAKNLQQIKNFTVAQRDMGSAMSGIKLQIGLFAIPALTAFITAITNLQPRVRAFVDQGLGRLHDVLVKLAPPLEGVFGFLSDHLEIILGAFVALGAGISAFSGVLGALPVIIAIVGGALGFLLSPIGLVIAGVVALAVIYRKQLAGALKEASHLLQVFIAILTTPGAYGADSGLLGFVEKLAAQLRDGFQAALPYIQSFIGYFKEGLETIRRGVVVVLPYLERFANFIVEHKPALVAAITAIGVAILIALGPGAAAVLAIVGLIALIGLVREHWDEIKAKTEEVFNAISESIDKHLGRVDEVVTRIIGGIVSFFREHWALITRIVKDEIETARLIIENVLDTIKDVFKIFGDILRGDWSQLWEDVKGLVSDRIEFVKNLLGTKWDEIKAVAKLAWEAIRDAITNPLQAAADLGRNILNGLTGTVEGLINAVLEGARRLDRALPEFLTPWDVGGNIHTPRVGETAPASGPALGPPVPSQGGGWGGPLGSRASSTGNTYIQNVHLEGSAQSLQGIAAHLN